MRPILPGDLDLLARHLAQLTPGQRGARVRALLDAADLADRYRKRLGRVHPQLGDGSLMAAILAGGAPAARTLRCDGAYCRALGTALAALDEWRRSRRQTGFRRGGV